MDLLNLNSTEKKKLEAPSQVVGQKRIRMLRNTPFLVRDSVRTAIEVFDSLLNTYKIMIESGVEVQKKLQAHPNTRKMGILWRLRSASLKDTPKSLTKGNKRVAPFSPRNGVPRNERGVHLPVTQRPPGVNPPKKREASSWWRKKIKQRGIRRVKREKSKKCAGGTRRVEEEYQVPGSAVRSKA